MKRFIGLFLTVAGGAAALFGLYHVLNGESATQLRLAGEVAISAMNVGLVGVLLLTLGLLWMHE